MRRGALVSEIVDPLANPTCRVDSFEQSESVWREMRAPVSTPLISKVGVRRFPIELEGYNRVISLGAEGGTLSLMIWVNRCEEVEFEDLVSIAVKRMRPSGSEVKLISVENSKLGRQVVKKRSVFSISGSGLGEELGSGLGEGSSERSEPWAITSMRLPACVQVPRTVAVVDINANNFGLSKLKDKVDELVLLEFRDGPQPNKFATNPKSKNNFKPILFIEIRISIKLRIILSIHYSFSDLFRFFWFV